MKTRRSYLLPVVMLLVAVHTIFAAKGVVLYTSSGLKMVDLSNGNESTIISGTVGTGCFSPNGQKVAFSVGNNIYTASIDGSGKKQLSGSITSREPSLTWTNADWIYYSKGTTIFRTHATRSSSETVMRVNLNWSGDRIRTISVSMDGKKAASWGRPNNDGHAIRYDLVNKKVVEAVGDRCNAHVSPDGTLFNRLLAGHHDIDIYKWGSKSKVKRLHSDGRIGNNWGGWSNHDNNVFMYDGTVVTISDDNRIARVSGTAWDYYPESTGGGTTSPTTDATAITSGPSDGSSLEAGTSYSFGGEGSGLVWTYDIAGDGQLAEQFGTGSSASLSVPTGVSDGTQLVVELSGDGGSDSRWYTVTVGSGTTSGSSTTITSGPGDNSSLEAGTSYDFGGEGSGLVWTYDIAGDGQLAEQFGTGSSASLNVPADLGDGTELVVKLSGDGGSDSRWYTVTVGTGTTTCGTVSRITHPSDGYDFIEGTSVTLTGEGCNLKWEYDANSDGKLKVSIGTGTSVDFTVPTDVSGARTITIYLTGDNGVDSISGTIHSGATAVERTPVAEFGQVPWVKLYGIDGTLVGVYEGARVREATVTLPAGFYYLRSASESKLITVSPKK